MNNEESIKIGRISIQAERALKISLTSDVHIYVEGAMLDKIAAAHPNHYLQIMENVKALIKEADFVHLSSNRNRITFVRFYFGKNGFAPMAVSATHEGTPKRWCLESMVNLNSAQIEAMAKENPFVRMDKGKKTKKD